MRIIAIEHENDGIDANLFATFAQDEARHVWQLYMAGIIREPYFRADRKEAVLVLECESVEQAEMHLAEMPFVKNGLISFELIPLAPYPGFDRLFAK